MAAAANYAFANRQVLTHRVREAIARALALPVDALGLSVLCDVPHNLATVENHVVEGRELGVCVHRRCASRALPPGHPGLSGSVRALGQPVVLPGDMGRYSLVLLPLPGVSATFHSLPHGAGRCLGRSMARRRLGGRDCAQELAAAGIEVRSAAPDTLAECTPEAYHGLDGMAELLAAAGLARTVARLRPLGVLRG
jgi:tRNA-splicing ligase RtcB